MAVSGGSDSVALLYALRELAPELGIVLGVVHLNHKLRGADADADAEFTGSLARSLDLDFVLQTADVGARAAEGRDNLEQAARRIRYEFFRQLVAQNHFQRIATGHTRTDQAETVLFRFLRGATTAGLAGVYPVVDDIIVRPLIGIERAEVLEYLKAAGRTWREDASNQNRELARNRLRHELLPQLAREWNPSLAASLAQLGDWARDEEDFWRAEIHRLAPEYLRLHGPVILMEAPRVAMLPAAVVRRLLRHAVEQVRGDLRGVEFVHIEQIRSLLALEEGHGRVQIPGVDVFRSFDQVRLAPAGYDSGLEGRDFALPLTIPGTYDVEHTKSRFCFKLIGSEGSDRGYNMGGGGLDWERMPRALWLRNWRPGDRYQALGSSQPEKLKDLFQRRKVPLWERRRWPVVASEERVVWARGFGPAADLTAGPQSRTVLEITEF